MIIRALSHRDTSELTRISNQYRLEFDRTEFESGNFISQFVVLEDEIPITIFGVRNIAEVVAVTDKNADVKVRREALIRGFDAASHLARSANHNQLHAFVQDSIWHHQLLKHGFRNTAGKSVVIDL